MEPLIRISQDELSEPKGNWEVRQPSAVISCVVIFNAPPRPPVVVRAGPFAALSAAHGLWGLGFRHYLAVKCRHNVSRVRCRRSHALMRQFRAELTRRFS